MTITESSTGGHLLSASWLDTAAYGPVSELLADDALHFAYGPRLTRVAAAPRRPQPHGLSVGWAYGKLRALRTLDDEWDGHGAVRPGGSGAGKALQGDLGEHRGDFLR